MNIRELQVSLIDMVMSLSQATDVISPAVANHQKRVAYMAAALGYELGLDQQQRSQVLMAGALHDVGALSLQERLQALTFDAEQPAIRLHARVGATLLRTFPLFGQVAELVEHHHTRFDDLGDSTPAGARLIQLADRVDVLLNYGQPLLAQTHQVRQQIQAKAGSMFDPEVVRAFSSLADRESFWLELSPNMLDRALARQTRTITVDLDINGLLDFSRLFGHIIDFRSRFTATHSSGVAAIAEALAELAGLSRSEGQLLRIAGYLHDLGKLAIPQHILEKPGALTAAEYDLIRGHTFYTHRILETVRGLETLASWAAYHHERLDGSGYPFHCTGEEMSLSARIMAVADVFTAVCEDRPYRQGLAQTQCARLLDQLAEDGGLDQRLVELVLTNFQYLNEVRFTAQLAATADYQQFWLQLG